MSKETTVGPYRTIKADVDDWYVVQGPTMVFGSHGWLTLHDANMLCDRLNAAYAAGQASREQQAPDNLEEKAREWKCRAHGLDIDLNRNSNFPFTVQEVAAFARSLAQPPIAGKEAIRSALESVIDEWIIDVEHGVTYNDGALRELYLRIDQALALLDTPSTPDSK